MADIADIIDIINSTPIDQAILLVAPHGVGKSETIRDTMVAQGYRIVPLFLGQAADAGDIIGLPTKRTVHVPEQKIKFSHNGKETIDVIPAHDEEVTDFAPPKWWPLSMDEKVVIFLDEINRGKPEIMQCVMDMVLNRRLNGRYLPPNTRIIAAMNPLDDGYYQVEELDPALMDRFNVYDFKPEIKEWLEWANRNECSDVITGFIAKHSDMLDPPSSKEASAGKVYPSRRSWKRVSDIIKNKPELLQGNRNTFKNIVMGIVGINAQAMLNQYIQTLGSGVTAENILLNWDEKLAAKTKKLQMQEMININLQLALYLKDHVAEMKADKENYTIPMIKNLEKYINSIPVEAQAGFFGHIQEATNKQEIWPRFVFSANKSLGTKMMATIAGK